MAYGTEEYYPRYNSDVLNVLQNRSRMQAEQAADAGSLAGQGVASAGQEWGDIIGKAPAQYEQGKGFKRAEEQHGSRMRIAGQTERENELSIGAKQRMEKIQTGLDTTSPQALAYQNELAAQKAGIAATNQNIAASKYQVGSLEHQSQIADRARRIEERSQLLAMANTEEQIQKINQLYGDVAPAAMTAPVAQDPRVTPAIQKIAAMRGITPMAAQQQSPIPQVQAPPLSIEGQIASAKAQGLKRSMTEAGNTIYNSSPGGTATNAQLEQLTKDLNEYELLVPEVKKFNASSFIGDQRILPGAASEARGKVMESLARLNAGPEDIWGPAGGTMTRKTGEIRDRLQRQISSLKAVSPSMGPQAQARIQALEQQLHRIDLDNKSEDIRRIMQPPQQGSGSYQKTNQGVMTNPKSRF